MNSPRRAATQNVAAVNPMPGTNQSSIMTTQSMLSKPSTGNLADVTDAEKSGMGNGLVGATGDTLAMKTGKMIEARNRRNYDLANRSR